MSKLKAWRKAKSLTQGKLAARIGTTTPTICKIENGDQWPGPKTLAAIEKTTRGEVTASDIAADYNAKNRKHQIAAE